MTKILICGHIDLSEEDFNKYYLPSLEKYSPQYDTFYVGGAKGADTFAQKYLGNENAWDVTVCDKGEQNNNLFPTIFKHKNGFASYIDRDDYMTSNSSDIIVFLRKHYMSIGSGSFSNVVRMITDRTIADNFMKHARSFKYNELDILEQFYDQIIDSFEEFTQNNKTLLKNKVKEIMVIV